MNLNTKLIKIFKINNIRPRIVPVLQKPYNTSLSFHSEIGGDKYETLQTYNNIYEYLTNEK